MHLELWTLLTWSIAKSSPSVHWLPTPLTTLPALPILTPCLYWSLAVQPQHSVPVWSLLITIQLMQDSMWMCWIPLTINLLQRFMANPLRIQAFPQACLSGARPSLSPLKCPLRPPLVSFTLDHLVFPPCLTARWSPFRTLLIKLLTFNLALIRLLYPLVLLWSIDILSTTRITIIQRYEVNKQFTSYSKTFPKVSLLETIIKLPSVPTYHLIWWFGPMPVPPSLSRRSLLIIRWAQFQPRSCP